MNMFMFSERGRIDHGAVGGPSNLPLGTGAMCGLCVLLKTALH